MHYGLSKEQIIATRAANEIFLHLIKLIIYILIGLYSKPALWFGLAIAAASIISSYTVKFILPFLSEFVFRKIGYGAMVLSGIFLLFTSSQHIIQIDKFSFSTHSDELTVKWRQSNFTLEYAFDDGLEVERPIRFKELPPHLQLKYSELIPQYDEILMEKVLKLGEDPSYEFYCYKDMVLTKMEFDEVDAE